MKELKVISTINTNQILAHICKEFDYTEIFEFIKNLDLRIGDWDFTKLLIDYYEEQREIYDEEIKECGEYSLGQYLDNSK